jgi:DNA adenine methylase
MPDNKSVDLFGERPARRIFAKPFVKWVGGKTNLLKILESQLPVDFDLQERVTYIEPFVGGGAMLFHMLTTHPNIRRVVINDINKDLIRCYQLIKDNPQTLIELLRPFEQRYYELGAEERKLYYYEIRKTYNEADLSENERAAYMIFLNITCFRGMYRENASGGYNVPFGHYLKPKICNVDVIMADHEVLKKVDIYCGDYKNIISHLGKGYNFVYFDPPYRPLLGSSNFNQYSKSGFGDPEQVELKAFCDRLTAKGCKIMLSNSYSTNEDGSSYFETLYKGYTFGKVLAPRFINAYADKREKQTEVLIKNYNHVKQPLSLFPEL